MSPDDKQPSETERTRVRGFLQLLLEPNGELPEATPEIMAFLEHAAERQDVSEGRIVRIAERARRQVLADRLSATEAAPNRSLGHHLRAKRAEARLESASVASALELEQPAYEEIEEGRRSPLSLAAEVLAEIVRLFNLSVAELRRCIVVGLQEQGGTGFGLARREEDDHASAFLAVAARDLLRAGGKGAKEPDKRDLERLEKKLAEVQELLTEQRQD